GDRITTAASGPGARITSPSNGNPAARTSPQTPTASSTRIGLTCSEIPEPSALGAGSDANTSTPTPAFASGIAAASAVTPQPTTATRWTALTPALLPDGEYRGRTRPAAVRRSAPSACPDLRSNRPSHLRPASSCPSARRCPRGSPSGAG